MRIWSKDLIKVLPTKQLKAMRYELGDMIKQYPNIKHPLVKFANNYDIAYLGQYFREVILECEKRKINMKEQYNIKIAQKLLNKTNIPFEAEPDMLYRYWTSWDTLKFKEDNNRYLTQCYYNLQEKYDRGIITSEEWNLINKNIGGEIK